LDGNGVIDASDTQILARNYGFLSNRPPQPNPALGPFLTHVDLPVAVPLDNALIDPDGDGAFYQLVGATGGTASLNPDGHSVPLLGGYMTYASSNGAVLAADASGVLQGLSSGFAAAMARHGVLAAATAVTVGDPEDMQGVGFNGLTIYPEALTLPEIGGRRQF